MQVVTAERDQDNAKEEGHDQGCSHHVFVEDGHEARQFDVFNFLRFSTFFTAKQHFRQPAEHSDTKHLLMGDAVTGTVGEAL